MEVGGRRLKLTNLDKVLYPETGTTKAEVLDYYSRVAEVLIPHAADRPATRKRWPNGVDGQMFFEKQLPAHAPDWVRSFPIPHSDGPKDYPLINDLPTLIWLAVPSINANATNTVAIWPGTLGSVWAYRRELKGVDPRVYALIVPSVVGGGAGAVLLRLTPPGVFDVVVPVLVGFATFLFMIQEPLQRRFNWTVAHEARSHWLSWTMFYQLLVGLSALHSNLRSYLPPPLPASSCA